MAATSLMRPYLAAIIANLSFGITIVSVRFAVAETDPYTLAFLRYLIASLTLLPFLFFSEKKIIQRKDFSIIFALGILQFGLFPLTYTASLNYTYASRGAIVFANVPLLTFTLACLMKFEVFSRIRLLGTMMALLGVALALGNQAFELYEKNNIWLGDLLMFITVLMGCSYNVFSRPMVLRYPSILTTTLFFLSGTFLLGIVAAFMGNLTSIPGFSPLGWVALIFSGTIGGSLAYFLFTWALEKSSPTQVAVFVPLSPITATLLGACLLDEPITIWFILGLASVIAGIYLVTRPQGTIRIANMNT